MKQTNALKRAFVPVLAVMFLVLMVFGINQAEAATNTTVTFSQSGGTSTTYYRDPSFSLEKSASWITISTSSPSAYTIKASSNSTGKGRIGYVYEKRQGSIVKTYTVIQQGSTNLSVGIAKGSTSTYGKNSNQSISVSGSWITIYRPNDYNFRIDYSANTTGSTRTGYVYVKEGSTIFTTYKITQSSTVTVTYDKNGGSGSNFSRTIAYGSTYGKVDNPTRTGYNFAGWYTAKSGGSQVTETTKMQQTANHTLYARWSPKTFTVSFNSQGGSTVSSKTVTYDSTYGSLTNPTKSGYTFAGWFTAASGGSQITASTKVALTANQVLYAHWTANSYTLSFNSQGGSSISAKTVTYGSKYGTLSSPTRTGYTFAGWFTAASGGSQVTSSTTVSTASNHTLYARWTANKYTVTYDKNGGSGDNSTRSIAYGSTYGKVGDPTRTGYEFHGWYTSKTFQTQVVETTLMKTAANHTLYAKWTPKTYTVTFMDGGTRISSKTVTYDSTYGTLPSRSMTGHTFNGWYTAASGGSRIIESANVTITANQTLYAQWSVNKYTVTYDKNGGSGSNFTRSIAYGSNYVKVDNPTKPGYNFAGWFTAKSGGSQVTETTKMQQTANHTLYARWTPKTFTVSFSSLGGGAVSAKTVTYDSTYGTLATPNYAGYNFVGWFTAASGGAQVKADTKVTITADHTLYARYTPKTLTVSFDSQGGSSVSAKSVTFGGTYGTLSNSAKNGYTFAGWYTAASGGSQVTANTSVTNTGNHTLYAHWTANKYTVTYDKNGGDGDNYIRSIAYGSTYGKVGDPARTGYEFHGWWTAKTGGNQVTETTIMSTASNHTLYARWTPKTYTVTFMDGGTRISTKNVTYDSTYGTLPSRSMTGQTFNGWYTAASGGSRITESTKVTITSNQTLYAQWTIKYTVTYDLNGGDGDNFTRSIVYGSTYGSVADPTREGCEFKGWYTAKTGGDQVFANTIMTTMKNHTLYARWEGISYTVVFHDVPVPDAENGEESERYSTAEKFRVKYNYVESKPFNWFKGWSRVKNAKEPEFLQTGSYNYKSLISLEILTDSNPNNNRVDLYPVWESTTYTVTYSWDFGSQDVVHTSENDYLTKGEVNPPTVVGENQSKQYFIGWSPFENDDTYVYSNESKLRKVLSMMDMDNSTLYAMYGYMGDAPSYILDSEYINSVWTDKTNVSIFIRKEYIGALLDESSRWEGIVDTKDVASTDDYPMLERIRNALYFGSSGYKLRDVCQVLNEKSGEIDRRGLQYLQIRVLNTFDGVTLSGVYKNHVAPWNGSGEWYDLSSFTATLPGSKKTELSSSLTVTDAENPYWGAQGDYEDDEEVFLVELEKIVRGGIEVTPTESAEEYINFLVEQRMSVFDGGICGPMAAVNVALYFTDPDKSVTKEEVRKELLDYFTMENYPFAWTERRKSGGDGWGSLTHYLDQKLSSSGLDTSAGLEGIQGSVDKQFILTKQMIQKGYPVIMSFYDENVDCNMYELQGNKIKRYDTTAGDHFFIVTGIYESARGESIYFKVSSWGKELYINWNEYAAKANVGLFSGDMGCGYVVITAK